MEVLEAIKNRRSVREYSNRAITPGSYKRLKSALRYAPSACNFQPWRFILVEDAELRSKVAQACKGQMWMAQAPVIVAACGFAEQAYQKMGGYGNSIDIDVGIALDHLSLAAVAEGLGTCWIGAFHEQQVKELLSIPSEAKVVALMPVGYPASEELNHPVQENKRKKAEEVFRVDGY